MTLKRKISILPAAAALIALAPACFGQAGGAPGTGPSTPSVGYSYAPSGRSADTNPYLGNSPNGSGSTLSTPPLGPGMLEPLPRLGSDSASTGSSARGSGLNSAPRVTTVPDGAVGAPPGTPGTMPASPSSIPPVR